MPTRKSQFDRALNVPAGQGPLRRSSRLNLQESIEPASTPQIESLPPSREESHENVDANETEVPLPVQKSSAKRRNSFKVRKSLNEESSKSMLLWGYTLVILSFLTFVLGLYATVVSPFLPDSGNLVSLSPVFVIDLY